MMSFIAKLKNLSPQHLVKVGVSPVLALIWLFLLLFTGSIGAGFVSSLVLAKGVGLLFFTADVQQYGYFLKHLLIADVVFYTFVYVLFLRKLKLKLK
ncbi:hypothetical protein CBP31_06175 [Oceanisphaera profunda]|uniref:Uncharacterized protein n=1 Tax=Oceanisphaera profunda TaxID=1416627 RepID=A0A1Y0D415_9GAMM|nr:hypothetical protein [Oceanisphaera profunda]ART82262.1 hypothetical protein CBP31_06175 [Oceanisphaera profunda]